MAHALDDLVEEVGVVELADELGKVEILEDLASILRESRDVGLQVRLDARLSQRREIHLGRVEERQPAGSAKEELVLSFLEKLLLFQPFRLGQNLGFGRREHALKPAQQREREDDAAILALLEVATEEVGQRPNVSGEIVGRLGHATARSEERGEARKSGMRVGCMLPENPGASH